MTEKNRHAEDNDNPFIKIINQQHEKIDREARDFLQDFLTAVECSEADRPASVKVSQTSTVRKQKPWEKITEKKDVIVFSFRVPRKEMQKLKYIAQHTGMSLNTICLRAIKLYNNKILPELEKETEE